MNIIQVSLNLKRKELPPLIIIILTLLEKSSTMAKNLDQMRDAIRLHKLDRRSPWCLAGEGLLTEPGSRPQISREYPYLWKSFYPTPAPSKPGGYPQDTPCGLSPFQGSARAGYVLRAPTGYDLRACFATPPLKNDYYKKP